MSLLYRGKPLKDMSLDGKEIYDAIKTVAQGCYPMTYYFIPGEMDKLDLWFLCKVERRRDFDNKLKRWGVHTFAKITHTNL